MAKNFDFQTKYESRGQKIARFLQLVPFVRMVGLDGSLARGEATETSDIDFFIVFKRNRLWLGRLLVIGMVQLTGFRRSGKKIAGRVCLNRFQTEDQLEVFPQTKQYAKKFVFFQIFWTRDNLTEKFYQDNNWVRKFGYSFKFRKKIQTNRFYDFVSLLVSSILEFMFELILGEWGENWAKAYQIKRINADPRTKKAPPDSIFFSDKEVRFHP